MQADLFQVPSSVTQSAFEPKESILEKYRVSLRLDQSLLILIALVVVYVIFFSAGFEKGKKAEARDHSRHEARKSHSVLNHAGPAEVVMIDAASLPAAGAPSASHPVMVTSKPQSLSAQMPAEASSSKLKAGTGKFTIQLVTFKTQEEADKLIEKLAQKGYRGFSVTQGKYRVVFVNDFESRVMAAAVMKDLIAKGLSLKDAYFRNMPKGA